jgi:hypothetical protein
MLSPGEFGNYLATGTKKRTRGQAIFFEVDQDVVKDQLPWDYIEKRCVPKEDGSPKSSVYLSIYRVLETIPVNALLSLYLTTDDGRVLELKKSEYTAKDVKELHLYQELAPVNPRIASTLAPKEFLSEMTGGKEKVSLPKLVFVELRLNGLASGTDNETDTDLPYPNIVHLKDCLNILQTETGKTKKTIIRFFNRDLLFRTIKNGFFIGDKDNMLYYPFPSVEELENKHHAWWRSANTMGFN